MFAGRFVCILLAFASAAAGGGLAYGQQVRFERFTMPSGLRVLIHRNDHAPVVTVGLMYNTGTNDQPGNLAGIGSVVAAMKTESSPHLSAGQYKKILASYGGQGTADISHDLVFFSDSFSSNMLKGAVWLASEKIRPFTADQAVFDSILAVVRDKKDRDVMRQWEKEERALYDMVRTVNLRLSPRMASYPEGVDMQAAKQYEALYFSPSNAVLAISGDIDVDSARKYVVEMFASLPPDTLKAEKPTLFTIDSHVKDSLVTPSGHSIDIGSGILATAPMSSHVDTMYVGESSESVIFAWQIPPYEDPQFRVFEFINTVLCSGTGSRLHRRLVEYGDMAADISTYMMPMKRASVFGFKVRLRPGYKASDVEGIVEEEIERLRSGNISSAELKKAVNTSEVDMWYFISSNQGMVRALAATELLYGNANLFNSQTGSLYRITEDDVRCVAERFLRGDNMKKIYLVPAPEKSKN